MAKGKKQVQRTDKKLENVFVGKFISEETKENRPVASKEPDCTRKAHQSVLLSPPCLKRAISPLSDASSMLIQDGNDTDVSCVAKAHKDASNETKVANQPWQKEVTPHANVAQADERKLPTPKPRSRNPRKGKKVESNASQNRKVTDFFPIRRSNRKTQAELKNEEHKHLDDLIKNGIEEGMQVRVIEGKGRGVFAERLFKKGDFVVEYHGDLLEL
uniref:SET domain-containing protein n=1 Tax=Hippocampus comes TaxID=109280 RepID=A0A3Q2YRJ9_HIPCM